MILGIFNKNPKELSIGVPHIDGLPISEGVFVKVTASSDKIVFENGNDRYELSAEKLCNIHHKTDIEIQRSVSSSIGGAVGGFVLFGPLGAMIGGRSKEHVSRNLQVFLVFEYEDDQKVKKYISFDMTYTPKARQINMEFFGKKVLPQNIQL